MCLSISSYVSLLKFEVHFAGALSAYWLQERVMLGSQKLQADRTAVFLGR
jgi:hypothetical protein